MVKIYPVTQQLVDLFFGRGWKDWTRVYVTTRVGHPITKECITIMGGVKRNPHVIANILESGRKGK